MTRRHDLVTDFVRECAEISSRFEEIALIELLALVAVTLAPVRPSAGARERLVAAISASSARFAPFFDRLSHIFDLRVARVEEIMARVTDRASWEPGPLPGLTVMHFEGGPRCAAADVGLVRLAPGFSLPRHRHRSIETAMILEGGYREDTGRVYLPGDVHEMAAGTVHGYRVFDDRPCLLALVLFEGVEFLGE
jgi:putative transcriptional regulator